MNAIIGDNGIITRAQEANIQSSIASLEEFLQLKYTENYEQMAEYQSKIEGLTNVCSSYFYIPITEGWGALRYVTDSDGHALYLIKKSGLPEEIRESLVGGDAGAGGYGDYQSLNDVYGVTSNLKVYYCSSGADSIKGLAKENLDNDNPARTVFESGSAMSNLLNEYDRDGDGTINADETKYITELELNNASGINSLSDLYNLAGLQKLTLDAVNLSSLVGLENCAKLQYLEFLNYGATSATIGDYSALSKANYLAYLYLNSSNDLQVNKVFTAIKNVDFSKLQYLGIFNGNANVSTVSVLGELSDTTKKAVQYLYLYQIGIESITCIRSFENVLDLRVNNDSKLTSLSGVGDMKNLTLLYANDCDLGKDESYNESIEGKGKNPLEDSLAELSGKLKLTTVYLKGNTNLRWVGYLKDSSLITLIHLIDCENLVFDDVILIRDIYLNCASTSRSISNKYLSIFNSESRMDYSNRNLTDTSNEILALKSNNTCRALNLSGNSTLSNKKLNEILLTMTNLEYLSLNGLVNLTSLNFVSGTTKLIELDLRGTKVTDLRNLQIYALELKSLAIDNPDISLVDVQGMLSKLRFKYGVNEGWLGHWVGIGITNEDLYKKLEQCTNLEYYCRYFIQPNFDCELDLTGCTRLSYILVTDEDGKLKIPSSCDELLIDQTDPPDITHASGLKKITSGWTKWNQEQINNFLGNLSVAQNLNILILRFFDGTKNSIVINFTKDLTLSELTIDKENNNSYTNVIAVTGLSHLKNLSNLTVKGASLTEVPAMDGLTKLTQVTLSNNKISDISALENVSSITSLLLDNNKIANLYALRNLNLCNEINLQNNTFYDTILEGSQSIYNLQVLVDLNKHGSLRKLNVSGCNNVTSFDLLQDSSLKWESRVGF